MSKKKEGTGKRTFYPPGKVGAVSEDFQTLIMSISDLPGRLPITIILIRSAGRDMQ
jgi:hypothetical protein